VGLAVVGVGRVVRPVRVLAGRVQVVVLVVVMEGGGAGVTVPGGVGVAIAPRGPSAPVSVSSPS
jgi:hypothetical protein